MTDMRKGMNGLSLLVQEGLGRDPHAGDLFVFRGRRGDLIKVLWHDGIGLSLYAMINDAAAGDRLALRQATIAPLVADLKTWMRVERAKLSRHVEVARAMDYPLKRWPAFTRFLDDGRICISNNAAERYAVTLSAASHGCSAAPIARANAPR